MKSKSVLTVLALVVVIVGGYVVVRDGKENKEFSGEILSEDVSTTLSPTFDSVSAHRFNTGMQKKNTVILDVRTAEEYMEGHIEGARNYDFYSGEFNSELAKLDRTKIYYIYCRSGNRSSQTVAMMQEMGFMNVVQLEGGVNAWTADGFRLTKECC